MKDKRKQNNRKDQVKEYSETLDKGFSLLELVIAVGILLVLTVGGTLGYSSISNNSKKAAVENASDSVIKAIMIKEQSSTYNAKSDGSFGVKNISSASKVSESVYNGDPQSVADEWMASAGSKNKIEVFAMKDATMIQVGAIYDNDENITSIRKVSLDGAEECSSTGNNVATSYIVNNSSSTNDCEWDSGDDGNEDNGNNNGNTYDNDSIDTLNPNFTSEFTYNCDVTTTGNLLPYNMKSTTSYSKLKAFVKNTTNSEVTEIGQAQDDARYYMNATLEANVDYKIVVFGTYEALAHNLGAGNEYGDLSDCLISVDKIAPDSGITILGKLGGKKLEKVPSTIPTTIENFGQTFMGAVKFNDPNVSDWYIRQAGNVSMQGMFANTDSFNQPLNWNVSHVRDMSQMFENAKSFNQPLNKWDTSNTYDMTQMFRDAESFDQDISNWDISEVTSSNLFSQGSPIHNTNKVPQFNN